MTTGFVVAGSIVVMLVLDCYVPRAINWIFKKMGWHYDDLTSW